MNNNTEEKYCSLEVSKLLKKSGFRAKTRTRFKGEEIMFGGVLYDHNNEEEQSLWSIEITSRPTHSMAIDWIHENFQIWINVQPVSVGVWKFNIFTDKVSSVENINIANSLSSYEATEEALKYVLEGYCLPQK